MLIAFIFDDNSLGELRTSKGSINEVELDIVFFTLAPEPLRRKGYRPVCSVLVQFAG